MAHTRELRLREEEGAERGCDPAVTLHLTPSRTHAPGQGLCGRDDWKASDGGSPEEGKPVPPPTAFLTAAREAAGAGRRGPICRHSGLGGDSTAYLCGEFKSVFPPGTVGSLVPILGGCPVTGQMGGTSPLPLRHTLPRTHPPPRTAAL